MMTTTLEILNASQRHGIMGVDICSIVETIRCSSSGKDTTRFVGSLFQYAQTDDLRSVEYKLKKEPETIRSVDPWGRTALHWAASSGCVKVAKYLYDLNPDLIRIPDLFGLTPVDHALLCSRADVMNVFGVKGSSDVLKVLSSYRYEASVHMKEKEHVKIEQEQQSKKEQHAFWSKQPMEKPSSKGTMKGRIKHMTRESASKMGALTRNMASKNTSYSALPIPAPFVWCAGNSTKKTSKLTLKELINLLDSCEDKEEEQNFALDNNRSLEPSNSMWRYKLTVGASSSGVEWRGIRTSKGGPLIAFIAGTKFTVNLCGEKTEMLEIHSLFVHPRCRGRRLTPLLVQSMVLHGIDIGVRGISINIRIERKPNSRSNTGTTRHPYTQKVSSRGKTDHHTDVLVSTSQHPTSIEM